MTIPTEIRLNIYGFVFEVDIAILEALIFTSQADHKSYKHVTRFARKLEWPLRSYDIQCKHAC